MDTGVKHALLAVLALGSLAAAAFDRPPHQAPRSHRFTVRRTLLGIPHFMNVASNLPFLVVGLAGLYNAGREKDLLSPVFGTRRAWVVPALYKAPSIGAGFLVLAAGFSVLARAFGPFDVGLFSRTGAASRHTLQHLASATASGFLTAHLVRRRPL